MASATSLDPTVIALLQSSHQDKTISANDDPAKLSSTLYPSAFYTDAEKTEISQWTITASHIASNSEDAAKTVERLSSLNTHLSSRTTVLGTKPSVADIALYARLKNTVAKWSTDERTGENGYHHIVRFVDFVQNAEEVFGVKVPESDRIKINANDVRVPVKPVDLKAEKERKKKEKQALEAAAATPAVHESAANTPQQKSLPEKAKDAVASAGEAVAAAAAGAATAAGGNKTQKKEKKEKAPKQPKPAKAAPVEKPLSPALIDLRVGHILKAVNHPNADSLYVSTIAVGDAPGTENTSEYEGQIVRTVCSGLNGLIPLEEMQGRKIVAVCNLKPVTMRGVKSCAMVLAASPRPKEGEDDHHKGPVELVNPPADAKAGERIYFEGWEGEPEPVLNPKKKIWETIQPGFTTTADLEVGFEVGDVPQLSGEGETKKTGLGKLRTKEGLCSVKTLQGATVR